MSECCSVIRIYITSFINYRYAIADFMKTAISRMLSFNSLNLWYLSKLSSNLYQNPSVRSYYFTMFYHRHLGGNCFSIMLYVFIMFILQKLIECSRTVVHSWQFGSLPLCLSFHVISLLFHFNTLHIYLYSLNIKCSFIFRMF